MKSSSSDPAPGSGGAVRAAHANSALEQAPASFSVLIVDDQEMVRGLCQQVMESLGYRPYLAESGAQALELLERHPVDIVIADLKMPAMSGIELLERIKHMEYLGCELEAAEGTFELLVREALHPGVQFFEVINFEVTTKMSGTRQSQTTGTVNLRAQDGVHSASATGHGPVNTLDVCLRQCLVGLYPGISNVRLTDYKVRVLEPRKGTAAKVRVLVEWSDHKRSWATVGVSDNVIEASWLALLDAIRLELMRLTEQDETIEQALQDYCWGV